MPDPCSHGGTNGLAAWCGAGAQGHIWHQGFVSGELKAELFRDVPDALAEWRNAGKHSGAGPQAHA